MALAPVLPEGVFSAALLYWLLSWGVALGMLWIWKATLGRIFQGIAKALTFRIDTHVGYHHTFHLGGWASTIDHKAMEFFSDWALGAEIMVGKTWHGMAVMFWAMSHAISSAAAATLDFGHYVIHHTIPGHSKAAEQKFPDKKGAAAAAVAAAAAAAVALKKTQRAEHRAEEAATQAAKSAARAAAHDASQAKTQVQTTTQTVIDHTKVITQVVDVPALPVPFGRTAKQLWRMVRKHEGIIGASVFAAAMANVLGVPNPRCLTKGPLGRFSRFLCGGVPDWLLGWLFTGLVEGFILSDLCAFTNLLMAEAKKIRPVLMELVSVEDALVGCHGTSKPTEFELPPVSLPAPVGALPLAA